jgi:signal peptidase II
VEVPKPGDVIHVETALHRTNGVDDFLGGKATANGPEWEPVAAARTRRSVYLLWLVALLVFVLDRWSKTVVLGSFMPGESRLVIPHLLWWTYVQNTHGAFGMFGNSPVLLIVLAVIVLGVFAYAFRDAVRQSNFVRVAFGMIVGGAVGNIVDRFQHQWVVDFIDFRTIWPNVFNVADSCITIGVALLILAALRRERRAA